MTMSTETNEQSMKRINNLPFHSLSRHVLALMNNVFVATIVAT